MKIREWKKLNNSDKKNCVKFFFRGGFGAVSKIETKVDETFWSEVIFKLQMKCFTSISVINAPLNLRKNLTELKILVEVNVSFCSQSFTLRTKLWPVTSLHAQMMLNIINFQCLTFRTVTKGAVMWNIQTIIIFFPFIYFFFHSNFNFWIGNHAK